MGLNQEVGKSGQIIQIFTGLCRINYPFLLEKH